MNASLPRRFAAALSPLSSVLTTLSAFALAGLLKHHYSHASAEDLRWILKPTTFLTSCLVSGEFAFQAGEGYLSRQHSVLISPACAGVNFLVVALLSLVLGFTGAFATWQKRWLWFLSSVVAAYVTTLVVNTLRIALSVAVAHLATRLTGLSFQSVHRLLGIFTYLFGLLGLCLTVQLWLSSRGLEPGNPVGSLQTRAPLRALACYAAVTLLVPLLGGAAHNPEFWSHAAPVSVLVGVSAALLFAARGRTWDDGWHALRSTEQPERVAAELGSRG